MLAQLTEMILVAIASMRALRVHTFSMTRTGHDRFGLHLCTLVNVLRAVRAFPAFRTLTLVERGCRERRRGRCDVGEIRARGAVLARLVEFAVVDAGLAVLALVAHGTHALVGELLGLGQRGQVETRCSVETWRCQTCVFELKW